MRCKNMCCISILADPRAKLRVTCFENGRENGINLRIVIEKNFLTCYLLQSQYQNMS